MLELCPLIILVEAFGALVSYIFLSCNFVFALTFTAFTPFKFNWRWSCVISCFKSFFKTKQMKVQQFFCFNIVSYIKVKWYRLINMPLSSCILYDTPPLINMKSRFIVPCSLCVQIWSSYRYFIIFLFFRIKLFKDWIYTWRWISNNRGRWIRCNRNQIAVPYSLASYFFS